MDILDLACGRCARLLCCRVKKVIEGVALAKDVGKLSVWRFLCVGTGASGGKAKNAAEASLHAVELPESDVDSQLSELANERRETYATTIHMGLTLFVCAFLWLNWNWFWILFRKGSSISAGAFEWQLPINVTEAVVGCLASLAIVAALAIAHVTTAVPQDKSKLEEIVRHYVWRVQTSQCALLLSSASIAVALALVTTSAAGAAVCLILSAVSLMLTGLLRHGSTPAFLRALVRRRLAQIESHLALLDSWLKVGKSRSIVRLKVEVAIVATAIPFSNSILFLAFSPQKIGRPYAGLYGLLNYAVTVIPLALLAAMCFYIMTWVRVTLLFKTLLPKMVRFLLYYLAAALLVLSVAAIAVVALDSAWGEWRTAAGVAGATTVLTLLSIATVTLLRRGPFFVLLATHEIARLKRQRVRRKRELQKYR